VAGPLSLTVDASVEKHSWKGRTLGICASLGLQTSALLVLGVAPLVSLNDLPRPERVERGMTIPVIEIFSIPVPPPEGRARTSPASPNATHPRAPSEFVVPTRFSDEIATKEALEDFGDPEGVDGGMPFADVGTPDDTWVPAPPVAPPPAPSGPVKIGGDITPPRKRVHVSPVYPPVALQARVQGTVVVEAVIDERGNVVNLRVLHSIALLDAAALDAVRQWEYEPTYLNGRAVPVVMSVNVEFRITR
jgi:periplasmic protein TonB